MTGYEMILLARAVGDGDNAIEVSRMAEDRCDDWFVCQDPYADGPFGRGPTLADALTALLRDLGVEVPEPPSAEQMNHARQHIEDYTVDGWETVIDVLRPLGAQTVLALLEGDKS